MESKHKLKHRFDIIRKLGQGTYGKVQLAVNKETGQEVAIKTIKKSKIENEQDAVRIRREIQIMSSIRHPNIVHIYEVFENKDKIVLVMQNASGGELYEYLSERKVLNDAEARRIFRQVVAAVYYIHKNKICHRDLKLENILLDEKGNAKIADFGLSNVYDEKGLLSTFCGSPLYASPEIVKGLPYFGPEVDCWSLGVLLYTLVYGAMPFDGSNFKKLVKQISNGDYFEPKLRSAASGLIRHLLTVNASERASIVDVCRNDWVNETYDTQLLQVAEDLANLSPVRLDLLIALQPQGSTTQIEQSSQQQQQPSPPGVTTQIPGSPGILNGKLPPTPAPTDRPTEFSQNSPQEQVLQSPSLMRMPSLSVKNCASLGTLRSSSSASSVKSALSVDMRAGGSNHSDDAGSTTSCNSFQASPNLVAESELRERQADPLRQQQTPAAALQSAESFLSSKAAIELGPKDLAKMLKSSDTSPKKPGPQSVPGNNKVQSGIGADYSLDDQRTSSDVQTHNGPDGLQHVQIISRKTETPRCKDESSEDSPRSLVWPAGDDSKVTSPPKKPHGRLSPEGAPDDSTTERVLRETRGGGDALNEVPRGLPMKSYKKFTFERNGGQVVVREKICQKEHRDGNRKTVIEKKVTSRTSSIDMLPPTPSSPPVAAGTEGFESPMTRTSRRDDSSDEDDFDIHFDSSHGPLGLLNVMKFMDRDFRTRWQNHPIFQNLSRRPLGMTSELMQNLQGNRRLHSPSLMKMFIERDSRDDDVKSLFERRLSPLLNHSNDRSMFASSLPTDPAARRNLERKLSRGSSLDRSSSRTPRMPPVHQQQQQSSVVDPMTAAAYEGFSGSFRDIPRYSRTVSDKTIGESHQPSPQSPTAVLRTRTQQGRPSVLHMELNFNTRHPASVGLVHSWSNHGLWQQQNHNQPHQNTTPSRIEMRVHYSTPSSPPPTASPVGMPPKPPKSMSQEQLQTRNPPPPPPPPSSSMEESVSDRINRRSYYHRFSSVDKQTRPSSTIWDQQGAAGSMSAGAGALWEAASPDKPLGISSRASMTKPPPPPPPQESNSTSM